MHAACLVYHILLGSLNLAMFENIVLTILIEVIVN
jgi:hypothetical protein